MKENKLLNLLPLRVETKESADAKKVLFNKLIKQRIHDFDKEKLEAFLFKDEYFKKDRLKVMKYYLLPSIHIIFKKSREKLGTITKIENYFFQYSLVDNVYCFFLVKEIFEEYKHLRNGYEKELLRYPEIVDFNPRNIYSLELGVLEKRLNEFFKDYRLMSYREFSRSSPYQPTFNVSGENYTLFNVLFGNFNFNNSKAIY